MRLWVNDDEFGEDFQVDVPVSQLVAALQEEGVGEVLTSQRTASGFIGLQGSVVMDEAGPGVEYLVVRIDGEETE